MLSDRSSWINEYIPGLLFGWLNQGHKIRWIHELEDLLAGDVCFLLSCGQLLNEGQLGLHPHNLVVHESDLPHGRGWSPLTWQVLQGVEQIPVTLFEAKRVCDSGPIYLQTQIQLKGAELVDELRAKQAAATIDLCSKWIDGYPSILSHHRPQSGTSTHYSKRSPSDSELDPDKSIADQFNLLRVVDNMRYPAFFRLRGHRYFIEIHKEKSLK